LTGGLDVCGGGRVLFVAIGALDLRAQAAARYSCLIPASERRAVHVAVDHDAAGRLEGQWFAAQPAGLALDIVADVGGVATTIADASRRVLASGASEVLVLAGQFAMNPIVRRFLHDNTASAIIGSVRRVPGALGVILRVPLDVHPWSS